jgi:hypothetical protein
VQDNTQHKRQRVTRSTAVSNSDNTDRPQKRATTTTQDHTQRKRQHLEEIQPMDTDDTALQNIHQQNLDNGQWPTLNHGAQAQLPLDGYQSVVQPQWPQAMQQPWDPPQR